MEKYIKGKQTYVDLLDMDTFSLHDIDVMMEQLGYCDEVLPLYYYFGRQFSDLDSRMCDIWVPSFSKHKLVEVYIEHGKNSIAYVHNVPNQSKIQI
uniref:Uncharacterized protein n=1 Tax=Lactuca sativa TaxID=4236 RepID=A0A9R1XE13_LACSA|nr:hypothetical protein LSAT_V11C400179930 [Lactuca sativa]